MASGIFIVSHDFVAVGIALPEIQREFSAGLETAQWAITGYSIAFSIAVVPGDKIADAFGAGRIFVLGAIALAAAVALVASAPEVWVLLAGRALQGVAVGLLWTAAIHRGRDRRLLGGRSRQLAVRPRRAERLPPRRLPRRSRCGADPGRLPRSVRPLPPRGGLPPV